MRPGPPSRGANSWVQTSHLMLKHSQHHYANSPRNDSFSTPACWTRGEVVTVHASWCQETLSEQPARGIVKILSWVGSGIKATGVYKKCSISSLQRSAWIKSQPKTSRRSHTAMKATQSERVWRGGCIGGTEAQNGESSPGCALTRRPWELLYFHLAARTCTQPRPEQTVGRTTEWKRHRNDPSRIVSTAAIPYDRFPLAALTVIRRYSLRLSEIWYPVRRVFNSKMWKLSEIVVVWTGRRACVCLSACLAVDLHLFLHRLYWGRVPTLQRMQQAQLDKNLLNNHIFKHNASPASRNSHRWRYTQK